MQMEAPATPLVEKLLLACMPERSDEIRGFLRTHAVQVQMVEDREGFKLEAGPYGLVLYTLRSMQQVWIFGYAAWKAVELFGAALSVLAVGDIPLRSSKLTTGSSLAEDLGGFVRHLRAARQLSEIENRDDYPWPSYIPHPSLGRRGGDLEKAVYDLTNFGAGYMILHELGHVAFSARNRKLSALGEERECDRSALKWLLENVSEYSRMSGEDEALVRSKRSIGALWGAAVVLFATPLTRREGSNSHPPIAERLRDFAVEVALPATDRFWKYAAAIVLAILACEGKLPDEIPGGSTKTLCFELFSRLDTS